MLNASGLYLQMYITTKWMSTVTRQTVQHTFSTDFYGDTEVTCVCFVLFIPCSQEFLSRAHEILFRARELLSRAHDIIKSCTRHNESIRKHVIHTWMLFEIDSLWLYQTSEKAWLSTIWQSSSPISSLVFPYKNIPASL